MQKRKFTVVTQLHETNNREIIEYIESSRSEYARAMRETFYTIKHEDLNKSQHNTYLQNKYDILRRTGSSIISDAEGRYNALKGLKEYERKQTESKIIHLESEVIPKLVEIRDCNSAKLRLGRVVSLVKQRNLRRKIIAKKAKLNRMRQKLDNLTYQIESGRLKLCFGTKKLLQQDYNRFVAQRDSQMSFVGGKDETACNQLLQLEYNRKDNQFRIQLRKDFGGYKSTSDKYAYGKVYFNHHKKYLISILRSKTSPLSYKIIKRNGRYYLHCTFEIHVDEFITRSDCGTIGLDFNKGFIALAETNKYGHLVRTQILPYRFKSGDKTTTDLQGIANRAVKLALRTGRDICIEDLDFKTKKSKTESKQNKKYNEMLHSLAYRQFSDIVESVTYRNRVNLVKVNPAWTSWLARQKYCPNMKLNVHVGASYVIARRGQGFKDTFK